MMILDKFVGLLSNKVFFWSFFLVLFIVEGVAVFSWPKSLPEPSPINYVFTYELKGEHKIKTVNLNDLRAGFQDPLRVALDMVRNQNEVASSSVRPLSRIISVKECYKEKCKEWVALSNTLCN